MSWGMPITIQNWWEGLCTFIVGGKISWRLYKGNSFGMPILFSSFQHLVLSSWRALHGERMLVCLSFIFTQILLCCSALVCPWDSHECPYKCTCEPLIGVLTYAPMGYFIIIVGCLMGEHLWDTPWSLWNPIFYILD